MNKAKTSWMSLGCVLLLSGCAMLRLKDDLKAIDQYRTISGKVVCDGPIDASVMVVLWALDESDFNGYWLTRCDMEFNFPRDSGRFYLMAFADINEDGYYQETEYAGIFDSGRVLDLSSSEDYQGLEIVLLPPGEVDFPGNVALLPDDKVDEKFEWRSAQVGEIVSIDHSLFSDANGALGLWTPLRFIDQIGMKIYFLEEYDPEKIPVFFVHGAGGHPGSWKPMVETLDQDKYQSWLAFYPSGMRLDKLGKIYALLLNELHQLHGFQELVVVAHSMGGLVSRSMIQHYEKLDDRAEIPVFVSLASPWAGHAGTKAGVEYAPAVIPSWYDMVPGSPFQKNLATIPLPSETEHYLLFAYQGKSSLFPGHVNNDGAVTISSQLNMPIQKQAGQVIGIDADHVGILSDTNTLFFLNQILEQAASDTTPENF